MSVRLSVLNAYLSANAYAQASCGAAEPVNDNYEVAPPPVFFPAGHRPPISWTPYRSLMTVRYAQKTLPQEIVDYLFNQSLLTGLHYSLFRHGPASNPTRYEVREGCLTASDSPLEEHFFDVAWVAHVHPPSRSPLPTEDDLQALADRALYRNGLCFRHSLFGFFRSEPVGVEFQVMAEAFPKGLIVLHRASGPIEEAADERIQAFISSYR